MTKRNSAAAALAGVVIVALTSALAAQDQTGPNLDPAGTGTRGGVAQMVLAQDLYALGLARGDALTVLTAAKLALGVTLTDVEREVETTMGSAAEEPDVAEGPVEATAMLAAAGALAGEDDVLASLVEEVEADGARDRIVGASRSLSRLPPGATDVWKVPFYGASYAELAVLGDGDTGLDVRVADENGTAICADPAGSDRVYCGFVPAWNGYFTVTVRNTGTRRNGYVLLTN